MDKKLENYKDYLNQILVAISQHSLGNPTTEPMELKHSRKRYIFSILDYLCAKLDEETFEDIVFTKTDVCLYCYSRESLEKLNKHNEDIYLNTSTHKNIGIGSSDPFGEYKHYYKFYLKENCYGLDINKFIALFSEKEQKKVYRFLYWQTTRDDIWSLIHENENEIIASLNSLEFVEELKYKK